MRESSALKAAWSAKSRRTPAVTLRWPGFRALDASDPRLRFRITYATTIPRQAGMSGSSAIVIAAMRAMMKWFGVEIAPRDLAEMALKAETEDLGITAGPMDRVIQAYEGVVHMDFGPNAGPQPWSRTERHGPVVASCPKSARVSLWLRTWQWSAHVRSARRQARPGACSRLGMDCSGADGSASARPSGRDRMRWQWRWLPQELGEGASRVAARPQE